MATESTTNTNSNAAGDNGKIDWAAPQVVQDDGTTIVVEFRDCVVTSVSGRVTQYFDKDKRLTLSPAAGAEQEPARTGSGDEQWAVATETGPIDAKWQGTIDLSGTTLVVCQAQLGSRRTYFPDGRIETEYTNSRVVEVCGQRTLLYRDGTVVNENSRSGEMEVQYDDRRVEIEGDGSSKIIYTDDSRIVVQADANQRVVAVFDKNGSRTIGWQDNVIVEVNQLIGDKMVRTILREHGDDGYVWSDNGSVIMDADSKQPLNLLVRVDMEGNVRFVDVAESGRNRPSLIMAANGHCHEDGRLQILPAELFDPALDTFLAYLSLWTSFVRSQDGYCPEAPAGFVEAAPGRCFSRPRPGKPCDFRVARSKDYGDGAVVHEYHGRYNNVPFYAKEVSTYSDSILGRTIEYDQPQNMIFVSNGKNERISDVTGLESEFEGDSRSYRTVIRTASGKEQKFQSKSGLG
jgi:hypothetical protein